MVGSKIKKNEKKILQRAGKEIGKTAALCAILLDSDFIAISGHLINNSSFNKGIHKGWKRKGWAKTILNLYTDSWPFAWRGLKKIIDMR